jgi:hypothetical protein
MSSDAPALSRSYDVFLSHFHKDAQWVEGLARRLTTEHGFRVWLDRWILIPGQSWQQGMAKGLTETNTCAVCLSASTPRGWFSQEVEKALAIQAQDPNYRVIPVLLPDAPEDTANVMPPFLDLRTWADFRNGQDQSYAHHVLIQGIKGVPVGPWPPIDDTDSHAESGIDVIETDLKALMRYSPYLHETVVIEYERRILSRRFGEPRERDTSRDV